MTRKMEHNGHGSVYMLIATLLIYLVSIWSVQQWAAIATIFAAVTTGCFNLYKWWKLSQDKKKDQDIIDNN